MVCHPGYHLHTAWQRPPGLRQFPKAFFQFEVDLKLSIAMILSAPAKGQIASAPCPGIM